MRDQKERLVMSTVERIRELLACAVRVPIYDQSGKIINPAGVEAAVEARAIRKCLKIAEEEENEPQP